MFVKSHSSKDVTLEGTLKIRRQKWQTVADLASRAIGVEPLNPSEAAASLNFCGERGFTSAQKVARECAKVVLCLLMRQKK
jgi:hypothetical protein